MDQHDIMTQVIADDLKYYEDNYKLSLKFFMNKNFEKSFQLIKDVYSQSLASFEKYELPEDVFVKIAVFYLIQVGLILKNNETFITDDERQRIVNSVRKSELISGLTHIYGHTSSIPTEIIYNLYLLYFVCEHSLNVDEEWLLAKFQNAHLTLRLNQEDKFAVKFVELHVFQVLPRYGKFDEAEYMIKTNPIFASSIEESLSKLNNLKVEQLENEKLEKQKEDERKRLEAELKRRDEQRSKELEKQKDLSYRTLKDIKSQYANEAPRPQYNSETSHRNDIHHIKDRIIYLAKLAKRHIQESYPVILAIIAVILISSRFINVRNLKLKDSLKETVQMAFKISYL